MVGSGRPSGTVDSTGGGKRKRVPVGGVSSRFSEGLEASKTLQKPGVKAERGRGGGCEA
jgi:hypothetical protein